MATQTPPIPFDEGADRVRRAARDASRLVLCLDFDGTLAPIVEDPEEAAATPANEAVVARLTADSRVTTAVVSGRALADVRERVDGPDVYAGNHGLELERDGSVAVHPVARNRAPRIARLCSLLERTVGTIPNCRVENKRLTGTVHLRSVPEVVRPVVRRRTRAIVDRFGGDDIDLSPGKRILEIGPAIPWGKGNAVELIEADVPGETVSVYVGDDVTDESAFQAVESDGFGIRVGGDEPSAASLRVGSPDGVASTLEWFESIGLELLDR
ncbi:trehalose-phosphatase [Halosolutus amylolyticus]|uniref:Trehalose 6-phosphate phosphatase n=1 Tax=Halosolutus amylolyticus TaxID=2932267 RepID=A0ABD5PMY3_9EURY|nr:trehalose-phosphatase [Halosolutus amylolyticus]